MQKIRHKVINKEYVIKNKDLKCNDKLADNIS